MKRWMTSTALLAASLLAASFALFPVVSLASASLGGASASALSWDGYRFVLASPAFGHAVMNSLVVATLTTVVCLAVAAPAAFALVRLPLPGKGAMLAVALATSMFPPIATVSPLYVGLRAIGLRDNALGLVAPYAAFALPLSLFVLTAACRDIPRELYDAARLDGATPFRAFARIELPLLAPAVATTGLLVFIAAYNEFLYALTFTSSPGERTVPVAIALLSSEHAEPWREIAAASILATAPLAIVTLVFQRRILEGVTAGAVKG